MTEEREPNVVTTITFSAEQYRALCARAESEDKALAAVVRLAVERLTGVPGPVRRGKPRTKARA